MEIKLHTIGHIRQGEKYQGWYVFIQTIRRDQGYYLISNNEMFGKDENGELIQDSIGYDNWATNMETLESYFKQYGWEVNWLDGKPRWLPDYVD